MIVSRRTGRPGAGDGRQPSTARSTTSPSPDPLHDVIVNNALLRAARESTNPYLRAGVLAVANNHPIASRRSTSGPTTASVVVDVDDWVEAPSRSRSNSTAAQQHRRPAWSRANDHHIETPTSQLHINSPTHPSSSFVGTQVDTTSVARGAAPRAMHPKRGEAAPHRSPAVRAVDTLVSDRWSYNVGSNVLMSEGTVLEHTSHDRGQRYRDDLRDEDMLWCSADGDNNSTHGTHNDALPPAFHAHNAPQTVTQHEDAPMRRSNVVVAAADASDIHYNNNNKEALFVAIMSSFNRQFGTLRPVVSYIPTTLDQRQRPPLLRVKTPMVALDEPPTTMGAPAAALDRIGVKGTAASPVITLAASPDRHQHRSACSSPAAATGGESSPPYDVAEQLMHQSFTCGQCGAKRMRGLQCSRCAGPLPQLRVCGSCQSWTRGNYCSTCGAPK